jgi:hypothetical protein
MLIFKWVLLCFTVFYWTSFLPTVAFFCLSSCITYLFLFPKKTAQAIP